MPLEKEGFVRFDRIDKSYDGEVLVVKNLNLNIEKGEFVTMLGPSGSGKTTSVDILIGLLKPSSGNVSIDQDLLEEVELDSFLAHVGYVQQTPFLFNGSIKDNLLWSNPSATEKEMWDALHLANIDSFVSSTERQLDTSVGDIYFNFIAIFH